MIDRCRPRPSDDGWGVWDSAVSGWRSTQDLDEAEARRLADELNELFAEQARPDRPARVPRDPPVPVDVLDADGRFTGRGHLTAWEWAGDAWWGHVTDTAGESRWYRQDQLRPAASQG